MHLPVPPSPLPKEQTAMDAEYIRRQEEAERRRKCGHAACNCGDTPSAAGTGGFPDGSYEIPLERRLEVAALDFGGHPRLGLSPSDKHSMPLTSAEGRQLLALLRAAGTGAEAVAWYGKPESKAEAVERVKGYAQELCDRGDFWGESMLLRLLLAASPAPPHGSVPEIRAEDIKWLRETVPCYSGASEYRAMFSRILAVLEAVAARQGRNG